MDDPEATQLVLEALFTVRGMVADIHRAIFDDEDGDDPCSGRRGGLLRSGRRTAPTKADVDRRLREMIEKYRRINEARRTS